MNIKFKCNLCEERFIIEYGIEEDLKELGYCPKCNSSEIIKR